MEVAGSAALVNADVMFKDKHTFCENMVEGHCKASVPVLMVSINPVVSC